MAAANFRLNLHQHGRRKNFSRVSQRCPSSTKMVVAKECGCYAKLQLFNMSDDRLRWELQALGFIPGPITDTTRAVLKRKLHKLRLESTVKRQSNGHHHGNGRCSHEHSAGTGDTDEDEYEEEEGEENIAAPTGPREPQRRIWATADLGASRGIVIRERGPSQGVGWAAGSSRGLGATGPHNRGHAYTGGSYGAWNIGQGGEGVGRGAAEYNSPMGTAGGYSGESYGGWSRGASLGGHGLGRGAAEHNPIMETTGGYTEVFSGGTSDIQQSWSNRARNRHLYGQEDEEHYKSQLLSARYRPSSVPSSKQGGSHWGKWKQRWPKILEYYLARLLWGLSVLLLLVFIGIITAKSGLLIQQEDSSLNLLSSDCTGRNDKFCKAEQKKITFQILSELYDFLSLEAGKFECGNPAGLSSKCVPISIAQEYVTNVSGHGPEKFNAALDWVLSNDRHLGIWVRGEDPAETVADRYEASCVESSHPRLWIGCRVKNAFYTALSNLFLAVLGILFLWFFVIILRYHWRKLEDEEKQMFVMVEKIIDAVRCHHKDWLMRIEAYPFIGIVHIRDTFIPPQDRKRLRKVWDRAVQFIATNESRLRTESQRVAGEDLMVWRWTQSRSDYPGGGLSSSPLGASQ